MKFADLLTLGFVLSCVLPLASTACAAESGEDSSSVPPVLPIEDFFRNPEVGAFSLSPDGAKLAFVKPWERRMNVYVRDIETGAEKRVTSATERDIAGFFWKGSDRIVYIQDKGGDENFHIYLTDIEGKASRDLTPFDGVRAGVLDDLEEDPEHMLLEMNQRNPEVFDVYRCELATGELTRVAENPGNITC